MRQALCRLFVVVVFPFAVPLAARVEASAQASPEGLAEFAGEYEYRDGMTAFVDLPIAADPGTVGRYCSGGIITAGRIVERAVGKPLSEVSTGGAFNVESPVNAMLVRDLFPALIDR